MNSVVYSIHTSAADALADAKYICKHVSTTRQGQFEPALARLLIGSEDPGPRRASQQVTF